MSNVLERMMKFSTRVAMLVSSQSKVDTKTRDVILPRAVRKSLVEAAQLAANRRLAVGTLAEISLRLPAGKMAINRSETWFANAADEDFTAVSLTREKAFITSQTPAQHASWHRVVYASTPAQAVFLCQPAAALRAAERQLALQPLLFQDAARLVGEVAYALPQEADIRAAVGDHRAVLIRGIGLLVWGETPVQVLSQAEIIEHWCQVQLADDHQVRGNA